MKLSEIDNHLVDYKTSLAIKQDAKNIILAKAADAGVLIDYSALENDTVNDVAERSEVADFFNETQIIL